MRVQHNISAINANRNLTGNNSAVSKSLEKLSSGYRINRAGDDAAGLAISEKMRAQISGLTQAETNCNDGVSLIQTAEGALTEVHSMLNRMVELAEQSANGTYDNATDRANLQAEVEQLKDEIDRISESTNFNGINLLDGSLASKTGVVSVSTITASGAAASLSSTAGTASKNAFTVTAGVNSKDSTFTMQYLDKDGNVQEASFTVTAAATASATDTGTKVAAEVSKIFGDSYSVTASNGKVTILANATGENNTKLIKVTQSDNGGEAKELATSDYVLGTSDKFTIATATVAQDVTKDNFLVIDDQKYQILTRGDTLENGAKALYIDKSSGAVDADATKQIVEQLKEYGINAKVNDTTATSIDIVKDDTSLAKGGLTLQIGDTSDSFNQLTVSVKSMSTDSLGIAGVDISTQDGAAAAVSVVKSAINAVSSTRGNLGAMQNRLEHTINNLSVANENITNAESRIRDTDMAKEMMTYTSKNILAQAAQSMLAQANQQPQQVLSLLQ